MTYVILGNGPAGTNAIESIRQIDQKGRIILVSAEDTLPYSRIMTPEYMTEEAGEQDLFIRDCDFYEKNRVELRLGNRAERLDLKQKTVFLENEETLDYDKLLIATGSRPFIPQWIDLKVEGVFSLWNKADAEQIREYLPKAEKIVIIGGGLVGLQAARALSSYGIKATVVEMLDRLMPTQLDTVAAGILIKAMESGGVKVLVNTKVERLIIEENCVAGLETDRETLPADAVIVATGVRPNLEFVAQSGLELDKGLIVNDYLQTSDPDVYAAGDVAQAKSFLTGEKVLRALWLTAVQQGKIAGANMAGSRVEYSGSHGMNSIQLFGLPIISLGELERPGAEHLTLAYPSSGAYSKVVLQEDKLFGLLMVGDVRKAGPLYYKLGEVFELNLS
ncbi:MAG: FAD-dependent oxidoreductase [Desulfitobacterium hafniense]|nr:FAD-dependent oxidoreductase [Desulfitobacterium hafniense]